MEKSFSFPKSGSIFEKTERYGNSMITGYKVQIEYDEPMPECCSDCRFNYDWLYCQLDKNKQVTTHKEEGRPKHCILVPIGYANA